MKHTESHFRGRSLTQTSFDGSGSTQCLRSCSKNMFASGLECLLPDSVRRRYFSSDDNVWEVTEELLDEVEGDLQLVVDCAAETGGTIRIDSDLFLEFETPIEISASISIIGDGSSAPTFTCGNSNRILRVR